MRDLFVVVNFPNKMLISRPSEDLTRLICVSSLLSYTILTRLHFFLDNLPSTLAQPGEREIESLSNKNNTELPISLSVSNIEDH